MIPRCMTAYLLKSTGQQFLNISDMNSLRRIEIKSRKSSSGVFGYCEVDILGERG